MSFLAHDMTPVDPLEVSREPRRDMSELHKSLRRPNVEPISHERHREKTIKPSESGRLSAIDHFSAGGQHLDGSRHHQTAPPSSSSSYENYVPEGPATIIFGISSNKPLESYRYQRKDFHETPQYRLEYQREATEEMKRYQEQQQEEVRLRREADRNHKLAPAGFILEKEFTRQRYATSPTHKNYLSQPDKYNDRTYFDITEHKSTHRSVLEPTHQQTDADREYLRELESQTIADYKRQNESREYIHSPSKGIAEILVDNRSSPKARLSREHTASYTTERAQMSRESRSERLEKMQKYRVELQSQLEYAKVRLEERSLDSDPVGSRDGRTTLRELNSAKPISKKPNEDEKLSGLYERLAGESLPIGDRLGNQRRDPIIKKYSAEESQERVDGFKKRQEMLDAVRREREELQSRLAEQERAAVEREQQEYPFYSKRDSPRSGKLKSHLKEFDNAGVDEHVREMRANQSREYHEGLANQIKENQQKKIITGYENDDQMDQSDVWKWNHDLKRSRRPVELTEPELIQKQEKLDYRDNLLNIMKEKVENQRVLTSEMKELDQIHAQNVLTNTLIKNNLELRKRPKGLRSLLASVWSKDEADSEDRMKKDHIPEILDHSNILIQ